MDKSKLVDMLTSVLEECAICGAWKYPGECTLKQQIEEVLHDEDSEIIPGSLVEYTTKDGPRFRLMITSTEGYAVDLVTDRLGNVDNRLIFDHPDFTPENIVRVYRPEVGKLLSLRQIGEIIGDVEAHESN